jgi:uncharacterized protein DUF1839
VSATAPPGLRSLSGHDPLAYRPHRLHGEGRSYPETNCYTDVLIELLHGSGYEPLAAFGHLVRIDFEGDQWTFFKPPAEDLELLFGVDIHEMQPYRALPTQIDEQIERGRTVIVELDAWYMPDTAATSYRRDHVKTSVAAEAIDRETEVLHYYHGPGLYELSGEDYRGVFRLDGPLGPDVLPPYTELVRFDAGPPVPTEELSHAARGLLARHLRRRPEGNPFQRFAAGLAETLPDLLSADLETYHAYAFATVRMAGSACELASAHVEFALGPEAAPAACALNEIVDGCKALSFRLARRRPFDPEPLVAEMARAWDRAIDHLGEVLG